MQSGQRYWIVGASEGLGRAVAHQLSSLGIELVVSARSSDRLDELVTSLPGQATAIPCDVADALSVQQVFEDCGKLDGVVYAAGVYDPINAMDWQPEAVEKMCDINFTGCARVLGRVVPHLISNGSGHIVLIGSLAGFRGLPNAIGYGASKAAVMHLGETLRADLDSGSFKVQVINPGFIKTRLTEKNEFEMPFIMTSEDAARRVVQAMQGNSFSTSFPKRFVFMMRSFQLLPDWLYYRLLKLRR